MNPLQAVRSPEHSLLCSPIGLQVIDSFTNAAPLAPLRAYVDVQAGAAWLETPLQPTYTPSRMLTLPGLGRRQNPTVNSAQQRYRLRIESDQYIAEYRRTADGFEFLVPPYDDVNPPAIPNANVRAIALHPSPGYPFGGALRVIHGNVRETDGSPVRDAMVEFRGLDRAMTDERGEFAFGLRRAPASGQIVLDVYHDRSARAKSFSLHLPAVLQANQVLTLL
ncbi:hypothetical protein [Paraburkholderia terrae]